MDNTAIMAEANVTETTTETKKEDEEVTARFATRFRSIRDNCDIINIFHELIILSPTKLSLIIINFNISVSFPSIIP